MSISKFKQDKLAELFDILLEYDGIHHKGFRWEFYKEGK